MLAVSVIIPTWNRAETIVAAVTSALRQSRPPLEILVCDDGSADDSEQRVAAIGDPRIRWLAGPRGGRPAIPRNRGIAAARGEWLAFLDSDDEWLPDKLERQMAAIATSGHHAACGDAWRIGPDRKRNGLYLGGPDRSLSFDDFLSGNRVVCSSALVHRSVMTAAEGFPESPALKAIEDYALWLRVGCLTAFAYVGEPLVLYRDDPVNSVRAADAGTWAQHTAIFGDFLAWCERHPTTVPADKHRLALLHWRHAKRERFQERLRPYTGPLRRAAAALWHAGNPPRRS